MKLVNNAFLPRMAPASALTAAIVFGVAMLANPAFAASPMNSRSGGHVMTVAAHSSVEARISSLHARLQITAAQEPLWQQVAQVMRDNAGAMDSLRKARAASGTSISAVDALRAYGEMVDTHADGVRKLMPAFQALYDSMSDPQKRNADLIFHNDSHSMSKKG